MMEQTPLEHVVFLNDEYKNMDWTDKNGVTVNQFSSLLSEADSSFLTEMEHRISIQDADEACNIQVGRVIFLKNLIIDFKFGFLVYLWYNWQSKGCNLITS